MVYLLSGCSDDSPTGVEQDEAPSVPAAVPAQIDNSLFENNNPTGEEYETFNEAGALATSADGQIASSTGLGRSLLTFTEGQDPTLEDGMWVWNFDFGDGNEEFSIRITAEELMDGVEWNLYMSGDFEGESVSEFLYLSGFASNDEQNGNWRFFSPEDSNTPVVEYQWDIESESVSEFSSIFNDPESDMQGRIDYNQEAPENFLEYSGFDENVDAIVYWNSDTGEGYVDRANQDRRCWDETFEETECS